MPIKIKVDIVVPSMSVGGGERVACDIADCLRDTGYQVELWSLLNKRDLELRVYSQLRIINFLLFFWVYGKCLVRVFRKLSKNGPDVVISVMPTANILLTIITFFFPYKLIISEHNISQKNDPIRHLVLDFVKARIYCYADVVVAVSGGVASYLKKLNYKIEAHIIHNYASSIASFKRDDKEKSKNLIWVGRLDRQKGPDIAIKAFKKSGMAKKGFVLNIIGPGDQKTYKDLVNELGYEKIVLFHGSSETPYIEVEPRLLLFTSRWEGFGLVLLEAIESEIPVLAIAVESGPDLISQICDVDRFVFPSALETQVISDLAALIQNELNLPIKWNEVEKMRKRLSKIFGRDYFKDGYSNLVESVLCE